MAKNKELFKQSVYRRSNGRFATPEQCLFDRIKKRNSFLEYENEMLRRKLKVYERAVLERRIII
jgi:hypothetical protein